MEYIEVLLKIRMKLQNKPTMITYASVGINSQNLKFIPLNYKSIDDLKKIDMSELKWKMLIGD